MAPAAYDEIADWYEHESLAATATLLVTATNEILGTHTPWPRNSVVPRVGYS